MLTREKILAHPWMVFFVVLAALSLGTIGVEITRIDVRFALMAQDMGRVGIGIFPTVNGVEYADYPSGFMILAWLTTLCGRMVTLWQLTLPSLILGAYIVTMTLRIGEKAAPYVGIAAAGLLVMSSEVLNVFMGFGIDVPVAAAGVTMLWLLQKKVSLPQLAVFFAGLLIVSFAFRGPLGALLLGAATGGWLLAERRWAAFWVCGGTGALSLLGCAAAGYCLIQMQGGDSLWKLFLKWQITSRMDGGDYHYYFVNGLCAYAPAGLAGVAGILLLRKELTVSPTAGWIGFALLPMILLSIPGCKHLRYMLIVLPALSLLGGYGILTGAWPKKIRTFSIWLFQYLSKILPGATLLALLIMGIVGAILAGWTRLPWIHWLLMAIGIFAVCRKVRAAQPEMLKSYLRITTALGFFLILGLFPYGAIFESAAEFVSDIERECKGNVYLYQLGPDHDDLKYILSVPVERRGEIVYLYDKRRTASSQYERMYPHQITAEVLPKLTSDDRLVLLEKHLDRLAEHAGRANLRVEPVKYGKLGHKECVTVRLAPAVPPPATQKSPSSQE